MTAEARSRARRRLLASPLRYPGGKGALYIRLRKLIRDSELAGCSYVEPYAGGAGAGLALLVTGQVENVVINDLDPAIGAFWSALLDDPERMVHRVGRVKLDVAEWRRQRAVYDQGLDAGTAALGFATFYLNRTNHSGVLNGGPIGGLDQGGSYKIDARFNREALAERIRTIALYVDKIEATCRDGIDVIKEFGRKRDTFIYADPPYFEKAGSLYLNAFTDEDHEGLAKTLNKLADRNWLLTYDDNRRVHDLYPERRRRSFTLNYSARRVVKATELAVLSDSVSDIGHGWKMTFSG